MCSYATSIKRCGVRSTVGRIHRSARACEVGCDSTVYVLNCGLLDDDSYLHLLPTHLIQSISTYNFWIPTTCPSH